MSRVVFLPAARVDVIDAHAWYERQVPGLGVQFMTEMEVQVERISAGPGQFPEVLPGVRRVRLRRFPYGLFFRPHAESVFIIACFHSSRNPLAWKNRVDAPARGLAGRSPLQRRYIETS